MGAMRGARQALGPRHTGTPALALQVQVSLSVSDEDIRATSIVQDQLLKSIPARTDEGELCDELRMRPKKGASDLCVVVEKRKQNVPGVIRALCRDEGRAAWAGPWVCSGCGQMQRTEQWPQVRFVFWACHCGDICVFAPCNRAAARNELWCRSAGSSGAGIRLALLCPSVVHPHSTLAQSQHLLWRFGTCTLFCKQEGSTRRRPVTFCQHASLPPQPHRRARHSSRTRSSG